MSDAPPIPDNTAVRVALWRALHVLADAPPHVFDDTLGLALAAPGPDWRERPDMGAFTRPFRASIVARARFTEDLLAAEAAAGVRQYVLLGAGLDTFALREPARAASLDVFEVDHPDTQAWKRRRIADLGLAVPPGLRFVPADLAGGDGWLDRLVAAGFDPGVPTLVACLGVSMYLAPEAVPALLRSAAALAPGSTLVLSFLLPIEAHEPALRPGIEAAARGAAANGTPWRSFFPPEALVALAHAAGFRTVRHVSADDLSARYFAGRSDGMRLPSRSEELIVATV